MAERRRGECSRGLERSGFDEVGKVESTSEAGGTLFVRGLVLVISGGVVVASGCDSTGVDREDFVGLEDEVVGRLTLT